MKSIIKLIKGYKDVLLVVIIGMMLTSNYVLRQANIELTKEVEISYNNLEAYRGIINKATNYNNVLKLKIEDLQASSDSLTLRMNKLMDENKIVRRDLKLAMSSRQEIITTIVDTIQVPVNGTCDFVKELRPNALSKFTISVKADSIKLETDIINDQDLIVYRKRVWKNPNKKFFRRLFTLDFKKIENRKYKIFNSNDIFKLGETRVVEIIE